MAIEEELLLEFSRAQVRNDKKAMKKYIKLLSKFKVMKDRSGILRANLFHLSIQGHNDCIQNFITDCLKVGRETERAIVPMKYSNSSHCPRAILIILISTYSIPFLNYSPKSLT